jgi:hypothetical protein
MPDIFIALLIGLSAALLDIIPMILKKMYPYAILSTFVLWTVLGMIIPFVSWGVEPWLTGLLIGVLASLPSVLIVWPRVKNMVAVMLITNAVLGTCIAVAAEYFLSA